MDTGLVTVDSVSSQPAGLLADNNGDEAEKVGYFKWSQRQ